jgi:Flp pilus assembly pilin Flp
MARRRHRGPHGSGPELMARILDSLKQFVLQEEGATVIEYALFIALITMACFAAISALGFSMSDMFTRMNNKLSMMAT